MSSHDVTVLNSLIATTIDSANGFEEAAKRAQSTALASQFAEFARDRLAVVGNLQAEVRRLGGTPEQSGTTKAAAHRRWLDLKNAVSGSDDAVLQEVENGETYIRTKYETALSDQGLSEATRRAIETAFQSVREGHDRARALRGSFGVSTTGRQGMSWGAGGAGIGLAAAAVYAANRYANSRSQRGGASRMRASGSSMGQGRSGSTGMSGSQSAGASSMSGSGSTGTGYGSTGMSGSASTGMSGSSSSGMGGTSSLGSTGTSSGTAPAGSRGSSSTGASRLAANSGDATGQGFGGSDTSGSPSGATGSAFGATGGSSDLGKS